MVRNCFVTGCVTNKWRRQWKDKRPALFCFPKSTDLLQEWMKVIPKRERESSPMDSLCSLHFKHTDILKYYEITGLSGQPKNKVERIERGCWTLRKNAVPCYFNNDNPSEDLVIRDVKHRDLNGDHNYNLPSEDSDVVEIDCSDFSKPSVHDVTMDHSYNLPVPEQFPVQETNSSQNDCQSLYTVCDLHEDALDLVLPERWSFIQNLEEDCTTFVLCSEDMSILRCVKFSGSCFPIITIKKNTILHRAVTSKEDIQELVEYVDNL